MAGVYHFLVYTRTAQISVNACWKNGGEEALDALYGLVDQQCLGISPHPEYSEGMWIFPAKNTSQPTPSTLKFSDTRKTSAPFV